MRPVQFKKAARSLLVSSVLAALSAGAFASDFYVVVPVKGKTAKAVAPQVVVKLNAAPLPISEVGSPFSYDLTQALSVTGDTGYTPTAVTWTLVSGNLPLGINLSSAGVLSGTPTISGDNLFTIKATYQSISDQREFTLPVNPQTLLTLSLPVNFGTVTLDANVIKTITLTNPGMQTISQVYLAQQPTANGLSVLSNTCGTSGSPISLAPNATCSVDVSWTPTDAGSLAGKSFVFSSSKNTLSVPVSGVAQPADAQVSALLRYDSTPFTDDKGNAITTVGTAPTLSASSAVGSGSASFASVGGHTLPMAPSDFVSSDFTVEAYIKPTSYYGAIFSRDNNTNVNYGNATFHVNNNGTLTAFCNPNAADLNGRVTTNSTLTLNLNAWNHVAWTRKGNVWSLFVNGKKSGTNTAACTFRSTDVTRVGHTLYNSAPTSYFNGLIDHFRIVKGRSIYNADFTPAGQ